MSDIEKIAGFVIAADLIFNGGKITNTLLEIALINAKKAQIIYVPVTQDDLVNCSFGC